MAKIDQFDTRILRLLQKEGRITNAALSEKVGLSASACLRRVQELERRGVIKGYRAILDPVAMETSFVAYVTVGLTSHTKSAQEGFERAMNRFDEVRECHNITGTVEYLLRVETRDLPAYKLFHTDKLGTLPQIGQIVTHMVMGSPKDDRA